MPSPMAKLIAPGARALDSAPPSVTALAAVETAAVPPACAAPGANIDAIAPLTGAMIVLIVGVSTVFLNSAFNMLRKSFMKLTPSLKPFMMPSARLFEIPSCNDLKVSFHLSLAIISGASAAALSPKLSRKSLSSCRRFVTASSWSADVPSWALYTATFSTSFFSHAVIAAFLSSSFATVSLSTSVVCFSIAAAYTFSAAARISATLACSSVINTSDVSNSYFLILASEERFSFAISASSDLRYLESTRASFVFPSISNFFVSSTIAVMFPLRAAVSAIIASVRALSDETAAF